MKGLILLADGFEQVEALAFLDVLHRARIETDLVSISSFNQVASSSNVKVITNYTINQISYSDYEFIYLPGGKLGVDNLYKSNKVKEAINYFVSNNKLVVAICAAPSILARLGYLDNKKYTCFPGFEVGKGTYLEDQTCVKDGNFITGRSMYWSIQVGEEVIRHFKGEDGVKSIYSGTRGTRK